MGSTPELRIVDARWTPLRNILLIECSCGAEFEYPADRGWPECPGCGLEEDIFDVYPR